MPDYTLVSDLLAPIYFKVLEYEGPHPSRILKLIPQIILDVWRIDSPALYEDEFKWDVSADPIDFYGVWRGKEGIDERTSVFAIVKVHGKQSKKDKMGKVTVWILGKMITKFPYRNVFEKALVWTYLFLFYAEQRRRYVAERKKRLDFLENEIRKYFDMMEKEESFERG